MHPTLFNWQKLSPSSYKQTQSQRSQNISLIAISLSLGEKPEDKTALALTYTIKNVEVKSSAWRPQVKTKN